MSWWGDARHFGGPLKESSNNFPTSSSLVFLLNSKRNEKSRGRHLALPLQATVVPLRKLITAAVLTWWLHWLCAVAAQLLHSSELGLN